MRKALLPALLFALAVGACAYIHPDTQEFGPSPGGNYNPVSHEVNESGR